MVIVEPWAYETLLDREKRGQQAVQQPVSYSEGLDSFVNARLAKLGLPVVTRPQETQEAAPPADYNLNFNYTIPTETPKKSGGHGFLGSLADIGKTLVEAPGNAVSAVRHPVRAIEDLPSGLGRVAGDVGGVLGAPAREVGEPLFAVASGELAATRKPILDDNGNIVGYYRDKPGFGDVLSSLGEALTQNPLKTRREAQQAFEERTQNPALNSASRAALTTFSDPVQLAAAAATGGGALAAGYGFNTGMDYASRHAGQIPGLNLLSPEDQQGVIAGGGLAAALLGGKLGERFGPAVRRGVEAAPEAVANAAAKAGVVPEGAVPGAGMVKGPRTPESLTPREFGQSQDKIADIAKGISEGTPTDPIVAVDGFVIDGHHRLEAYRQAGMNPEVLNLSQEEYEALKAAQFDDMEIAAGAHIAAGTKGHQYLNREQDVSLRYGEEAAQMIKEMGGVEAGGVEAPRAGGDVPGTGAPPPQEPPSGTAGASPLPEPTGKTFTEGPFTLPELKPQALSRKDLIMNAVKGQFTNALENDVATPAMRWRQRTQDIVNSQANRLATEVESIAHDAFPDIDAQGRLTKLPGVPVKDDAGNVIGVAGAPTIQDVAARLPYYRPYLNSEQLSAMEQLREKFAGYNQQIGDVGIDVNSRPDVEPGGFYMPRGRADIEGEDAPLAPVRGGSGKRGSRASFEKRSTFPSMAEGIDAGYAYAPLQESVGSYARQAGNRIIDQHVANYFKTVTDDEGNLLGSTPRARLLEQNPGIAKKVAGLRQSLQSLRGTYERLSDKQQAAIEDFLNNPAPDLDALRDALDVRVGANAVGKQGVNYGKNAGDLRATMRELRGQIRDLMPEWKAALEKARQTPRGEAPIDFYQLQGTSFPMEVANAANKYLEAEGPIRGRGAVAIKTIEALNHIMRGLKSTADLSMLGIQGLLGAARDPRGYAEAVWLSWKSLANSRALGAFMQHFDETAGDTPSVAAFTRAGLHIGGTTAEHTIGTGNALPPGNAIERFMRTVTEKDVPLTGTIPGVKGGLNPIRGANRAWGYFGDAMRLKLARTAYQTARKAGFDVKDPQVMRAIADSANRATGWSPNAFAGDLGELAQFAPRFFQSQLEVVGKSLADRGIEGMEARRQMLGLIGAGTMLTVAANAALGTPISWKDEFDPNSPNFLRIRIGGDDVSVFGPWDSLARAIVSLGHGDVGYMARSKASPVVSTAWDLMSGKTFVGDKASLTSPGYLMRDLLTPFSLSEIGQQNPLATGLGLAGIKATPMTPTEQLNAAAQAMFGKGYYDLLPSQQKQLRDEHPDIWQRKIENSSDTTQKYYALKDQFTQQQRASDAELLSGQITRQQWLDDYQARNTQLTGAAMAIYGDEPITNPKKPSEMWAKLIQDNTGADGIPDWDAIYDSIDSLPKAAQDWINDNASVGNTPLVQQYKVARAQRSAYYDLPVYHGYTADEARQIDQLRSVVRANATSADDAAMLRSLRKVLSQMPEQPPARIVQGVRKGILGLLKQTTQRKRYAATHPLMVAFYGGDGKSTSSTLTQSEMDQLGAGL